ncbi:MAG: RsmB/NOP family class I SAM-dependent RNA methyltransferase [Paracoccaceae bacterium]|jgi:16S rRNA (cytosine967-C5)-methyltransferase
MTPAARVQAAIEILDHIVDGEPAEKSLTAWARRSRFAGSKDRAAVRDHVFSVLRCRNSFAALGQGTHGRALMLGAILSSGEDPAELFTGQGHGPSVLTESERAICAQSSDGSDPVDLPDWLWQEFQISLGADARPVADALRQRAPIFLRVNLRNSSRDAAITALAEAGVTTVAHKSASTALIVTGGERAIRNSDPYLNGVVELQDGASQALVEALPLSNGLKVLDYCAGGGGKTLAMAALADLDLTAHDAFPRRMADLDARAARADIQVHQVDTENLSNQGAFDLVLCDAPCSGSGAWRRSPGGKWTLSANDFNDLQNQQSQILDEAAKLVCPGGVLAYATCSVLKPENQSQIDAFLKRCTGWQVVEDHFWRPDQESDGFYLSILKHTG